MARAVRGVPWSWVERLQKAKRVSSSRLALVLVYEHWRTGGRPLVLSNVALQAGNTADGVDRWQHR
jgi:hypothetical protein